MPKHGLGLSGEQKEGRRRRKIKKNYQCLLPRLSLFICSVASSHPSYTHSSMFHRGSFLVREFVVQLQETLLGIDRKRGHFYDPMRGGVGVVSWTCAAKRAPDYMQCECGPVRFARRGQLRLTSGLNQAQCKQAIRLKYISSPEWLVRLQYISVSERKDSVRTNN